MVKGAYVPFSCSCGKVKGNLHDVAPDRGNHLVCYCHYCQAAAKSLNFDHKLDEFGGTEVFQTIPSKVELTDGQRHLACMRLSPKGMLRWYASCCNTPLFTMLENPSIALAGYNMALVKDEHRPFFGDLAGVYSAKGARNAPKGLQDWGIPKAFVLIFWRAIKARLRGDSGAPFFDENGQPTVTPRILTKEERKAAWPVEN